MTDEPNAPERPLEELEIGLLLEGVYQRFGHDFRGYRRAVVRERLAPLMRALGAQTVSGLQERVLHDEVSARCLLNGLAGKPGGLFAEPLHFLALRRQLARWLRGCPAPRVWIADCLSAEEAYSVAILLAEERLLHQTRIFATTPNDFLLEAAKTAQVDAASLRDHERHYRLAGGKGALSDYLECRGDGASLVPALRSRIVWAQYSLATDASFNEFDLVICRKLRDFGAPLRRRVLGLLDESLALFGMLSVDERAVLDMPPFAGRFSMLNAGEGLYRRIV